MANRELIKWIFASWALVVKRLWDAVCAPFYAAMITFCAIVLLIFNLIEMKQGKYRVFNKRTRESVWFDDINEVRDYIGDKRDQYSVIDYATDLTKDEWTICRKSWKRKDMI